MSSSLSILLIISLKNFAIDNEFKDCKSCFEYIKVKDKILMLNCSGCNKNHKQYFNKYLTKRSANTYEFCNEDINIFVLMLRKGVYPYEYINISERFNETLLSGKKKRKRLHMLIKNTQKEYGKTLK